MGAEIVCEKEVGSFTYRDELSDSIFGCFEEDEGFALPVKTFHGRFHELDNFGRRLLLRFI